MSTTVAIIGAGPAGVYAAEALLARPGVEVVVIDRLPVPFGLVRYGVAPDHPSIRSIRTKLEGILDRPEVSFVGNVEIGSHLTVAELRGCVDAVVYAYGSAAGRQLGIPGEELTGSVAATDLVTWYTGHPDAHPDRDHTSDASAGASGLPDFADLVATSTDAVVVGAGNVALDVARVLLKTADELIGTDMPHEVLVALAGNRIRRVHLLCRRGPADVAFTGKELRELGALPGLAVALHNAGDLAAERDRAGSDRNAVRNVDEFTAWSQRSADNTTRGFDVWFYTRAAELRRADGTDRVAEVVLDDDAASVLPAELVVRAIGYRGRELAGVPFDPITGRVPHVDGRVQREPGAGAPEYVAGWIKRGPTGVIGTNKSDAHETVAALLADLDAGIVTSRHTREDLATLLASRGLRTTSMADWHRIDAAEIADGQAEGRDRATRARRSDLLAAAQPGEESAE